MEDIDRDELRRSIQEAIEPNKRESRAHALEAVTETIRELKVPDRSRLPNRAGPVTDRTPALAYSATSGAERQWNHQASTLPKDERACRSYQVMQAFSIFRSSLPGSSNIS